MGKLITALFVYENFDINSHGLKLYKKWFDIITFSFFYF